MGWEQVRDLNDRRRVAYWRLQGERGKAVGAVSRRDEGFRALRYEYDGASMKPVELGYFETKKDAQQAVEAAV